MSLPVISTPRRRELRVFLTDRRKCVCKSRVATVTARPLTAEGEVIQWMGLFAFDARTSASVRPRLQDTRRAERIWSTAGQVSGDHKATE